MMDTLENHGEQKMKTKIIVKDIMYLATETECSNLTIYG